MWASLQKGLTDMRQHIQEQIPVIQNRFSEQMEQLGDQFSPFLESMNQLSLSSRKGLGLSLKDDLDDAVLVFPRKRRLHNGRGSDKDVDADGFENAMARNAHECVGDAAEAGSELDGEEGFRLRIIRKIGEGGYSFVYLAEEVKDNLKSSEAYSNRSPAQYALKKVLVGSKEQWREAEKEIDVMRKLRHPNLLRLIDSLIVPLHDKSGATHAIYMVFPLYTTNAWDWMIKHRSLPGRCIPTRQVLDVFYQLCVALEEMHRCGLAHRDVKLHNLLIKHGEPPYGQLGDSRFDCSTSRNEPSNNTSKQELDSGNEIHGDDGAHLFAAASIQGANKCTPHYFKKDGPTNINAVKESDVLHAVLMDFGSASSANKCITSRAEALDLQEQAERCCTAPYRAPELWEVPSNCSIGPEVDIWACGCVLFTLMVGETPFERTANESGGNLMMAVMNLKFSWPKDFDYPKSMKSLVEDCLQLKPDERPSAKVLVERIDKLRNSLEI